MDPLVPITDVSVEANTPVVAPPNPVGVAPVVTPASPVTVNPVNPVVVAPNPVGVTPIVAPVSPVTVNPVNPVVVPVVKPPTVGPVVSVVGTTAPMSTSSVGNVMPVISGGTTSSVVAPAYMNPTQNMPVRPVVTGTTTIPKSEPTKEDNGGRGMDKKLGIGGTVVVAVVSMLILGTGLGVGVRLALTSQEAKKTEAAALVPTTVPIDLMSPTNSDGDLNMNLKQSDPWGYADDAINPEPSQLTLADYDKKYKEIRTAITERKYEVFLGLVSAQRKWALENPNKHSGATNEGLVIAKLLGRNPKINFEDYAVNSITFNAPGVSDIVVKSIRKRTFAPSAAEIVIENESLNTAERVKLTPWRYVVDVIYTTKQGAVDSAEGEVTFVFDKDKWVYQGEYWKVTPHTNVLNKGDVLDKSQVKTVDLADGKLDTNEINLEITKGQGVKWTGVRGVVFSIGNTTVKWDSGYLYGDTFTKKFADSGSFKYAAELALPTGQVRVEGVVNVK